TADALAPCLRPGQRLDRGHGVPAKHQWRSAPSSWHISPMGIFDRMSRVLSSNFNALLDKLEDPKKSVDLLLDQMREQIRLGRQHVVQSVAAEKQLKQKVADLDQQIERWNGRAEPAVRRGDDALAREALVQKRRLVGERDRAEALRAEQRANALEVKAEIE